MVPETRLEDPGVCAMLDRCFRRAGISQPSYWVIEVENFKANNAMIAGFRNGKGWFRPGLFITKPLLKNCPPEELEAVILHEVSHLALNHLRKRFFFSFGAVMAAITATAACLVTAQLVLPAPAAQWLVLACATLSFVIPFVAIKKQAHRQELEADVFAIVRLGATLEAVAGALRRIDRLNDRSGDQKDSMLLLSEGGGHPATEQRIIQVRQATEFAGALAAALAKREDAGVDEQKRAA
jgi:Zn-dependent protease with chaperone function